MKVLVTGVGGQLGHDVMLQLQKAGLQGIGSDIMPSYQGICANSPVASMPYIAMDITDEEAVRQVFQQVQPEAVIHCAAWTAVDAAEEEENQEKVYRINVQGTEHIANCCKQYHCKLLYISTDYVFDGQGETPWEPDCQTYAPLNVYGKSKWEGEQKIAALLQKYFIVRIAWVFGINGNNFIKTMLRVGKNHDTITVVNDQIGTPTYTYDLAVLLVDMIQSEQYGYYHATNEGAYISWYDFAIEIFRQKAAMGEVAYGPGHLTVQPVSTEEYGFSKAKRPYNSRLNRQKLVQAGFKPLPDWKDALQRYLRELDACQESL